MRGRLLLLARLLLVPSLDAQEAPMPSLRIVELVASPLHDWNGDAKVTASDEFVELLNPGTVAVDLAGWSLLLNDTTPETLDLQGSVPAGGRLALVNPPGEQNTHGHLALLDPTGRVVDEVRYGTWTGATASSAASTGPNDESLRLLASTWGRGHATPGGEPDRPWILSQSWFDRVGDRWFDPGNRSLAWRIEWTDSGRGYTDAWIDVSGAATNPALASLNAGRWSASGTLQTPTADFQARWSLRDTGGTTSTSAWTPVLVDHEPPVLAPFDLPPWTNASSVTVRAPLATDGGVGGIQYELEAGGTRIPWTTTPPSATVTFGNLTELTVIVRARDAYGHTSAPSQATVRQDLWPPAPLVVRSSGGYEDVRLDWDAPKDEGSGVQEVVLLRTLGSSVKTFRLAADATNYADPGLRPGDTPSYAFHAVDRAGNVGTPVAVQAAHEGRSPHVKNLRLSKTVWGPSSLRLHVDFDRRMDTAFDPDIIVQGGPSPIVLEGRWLANRTTYLVETDAYEGPDVRAEVLVRDAKDPEGRSLWPAPPRALLLDGRPPVVTLRDVDGCVGKDGLAVEVQDLSPSTIKYRIGETATTVLEPGARIPIASSDRVRVHAVDAVGRKGVEVDRRVRLDLDAPTSELGRDRDGLRLAVTDRCGVDPASLQVRDLAGNPVATVPRDGAFDLAEPSTGDVLVAVKDRVGNLLEARLAVPAVPTEVVATPLVLEEPVGPAGVRPKAPSSDVVVQGGAGAAVLLVVGAAALQRRRRGPGGL